MKKHLFIISLIVFISIFFSCEKEELIEHKIDNKTAEEKSNLKSTSSSYNYLLNTSSCEFIYQKRVPVGFWSDNNYNNIGNTKYPNYIGEYNYEISNTNLCGLASYLMGVSMVNCDSEVEIPSSTKAKARRLAECARRYKEFDNGYYYGAVTDISLIRDMANGVDPVKGDFTSWDNNQIEADYSDKAILSYSANRETSKDFIKYHLSHGHPILAVTKVKGYSYKLPSNDDYFTTGTGFPHLVLIVGVDFEPENNYYRIYFKDPLYNYDVVWSNNYSNFLNSMPAASRYDLYNLLAIQGM